MQAAQVTNISAISRLKSGQPVKLHVRGDGAVTNVTGEFSKVDGNPPYVELLNARYWERGGQCALAMQIDRFGLSTLSSFEKIVGPIAPV